VLLLYALVTPTGYRSQKSHFGCRSLQQSTKIFWPRHSELDLHISGRQKRPIGRLKKILHADALGSIGGDRRPIAQLPNL
jgi:hypothetical protein